MFKKSYLIFTMVVLIFFVVALFLISCLISWDYLWYNIKTFGQEKYKLTLNIQDRITNNPIKDVMVDVLQITGPEEKKMLSKNSDSNGVIVFYLLPGLYKCKGGNIFLGETDNIDLNENKEVDLKIWIPIK